jgi:hypothetical protein
MQLNFHRFLLASGLAILVLLTGCASAYRPTENAIKSTEPDDGPHIYAQVFKIEEYAKDPTSIQNIITACEKRRSNGELGSLACENPEGYKRVHYVKLAAGGVGPSTYTLVPIDSQVQIGSIIKVDLNGRNGQRVISFQPESEDCKWVGVRNELVDPASKSEIAGTVAGGFLLGATLPVVALPLSLSMSTWTGGVVCDGWDYRVAYKTWLENYRSM